MTVAAILGEKSGARLVSCKPSDSVEKIAQTLAEHRIGAIFIIDDKGDLVGIVSERDIVRKIATDSSATLSNTAADIMTKKVVTCLPSDTITMLMGLMTENRVRHIPVVVDGKVEGVISIGDVVKARIAAAEREAAEMMQYISSGV
ncbi:CBS domain protein [hydrothermal vent metagenome]|uniref:CBS domain protein n=1 Tax=hydrothermal vent metagenome TaxID=652676 RepID=A0A3B0RSL9_9ZZZZ